jgi:hypothetical protein
MEKLLNLLTQFTCWFAYQFDYIVGYIMTNPHKLPLYHRMMWEKYGERYCTKEQFDEYWNGSPDEPSGGYVNQD